MESTATEVVSKSKLLEQKQEAALRSIQYDEEWNKERRKNQLLGLHDHLRKKLWDGLEGEWIDAYCMKRGGQYYEDIPEDVVREVCKEWEKAGWIVEIQPPTYKQRFLGLHTGRAYCRICITSLPTEVVPTDV